MKVTVYTAQGPCQGCRLTIQRLDGVPGIELETQEVDSNVVAAVEELGLELTAPVVAARPPGAERDVIWTGFRPDRINELIKQAA